MAWKDSAARVNAAQLATFGVPITYIPIAGEPLTTRCILRQPTIEQSASPGYFADIDIDPQQIPNPQRKDEVVMEDGTVYLVTKVLNPPLGFITVAIHRKFDLP
jgi:hypothetical protein